MSKEKNVETPEKELAPSASPLNKETGSEDKKEKVTREKKPIRVRRNLDVHRFVTVRNGFNGTLCFVSPRTGERFIFDDFGDEQEIELQDLVGAKNSAKKFFTYNWFLIDDPEVLEYLGVSEYYRNALSFEELDGFFDLPQEEIEKQIPLLSEGQKSAIVYLAKKMIEDGRIDSVKKITSIERCLGVKLIEK